MASNDEKKEIAKQFILASPCHELRHVIKDVKVLVGDDELVASIIPEVVSEYNVTNFVPIEGPYGNTVVLCEEGRKEGTLDEFLDPVAGRYFKVTDHVKLVAEEAEGEEKTTEVRDQLQSKVGEYIDAHFKAGSSSVYVTGEGAYKIVINSEKSNPGSSWSGRWRSYLDVTMTSETTATVKGAIYNDVHYYEEGNVQMDTSKEIGKDIKADTPEQLTKRIVTFIEDADTAFHMKIDEMCKSLSDKSLKTLRRRLPVSKQLFNFETGAHKLAAELTKGVAK
eukprot:TRINITY_DN21086_c0_g1_i1.p1 TRINITY_DN21086_c0_g1~~TRINITY_DN21086_c0_g1_i1.p1  ORF type:complete len:280 (+),score=95.76 TRINITY_DN21086_c0_g1_i1:44-883(+)